MAHLVPPTSFRQGKTLPWRSNIVLRNPSTSAISLDSNVALSTGFERASRLFLQRRFRIFVVRGALSHSEALNRLTFKFLYCPRMKQLPLAKLKIGSDFYSKILYSPRRCNEAIFEEKLAYIRARQNKEAKFKLREETQVNKWISNRMFRGTGFQQRRWYDWSKNSKPLGFLENLQGYYKWKRFLRKKYSPYALAKKWKRPYTLVGIWRHVFVPLSITSNLFKNLQTLHSKNSLYAFTKGGENYERLSREEGWKFSYGPLKLRQRMHWTALYRRGKRYGDIVPTGFDDRRFSIIFSRFLKRLIKVKSMNVFTYLVAKGFMNYKNHQQHFWHWQFRNRRFHYANFYDVINGFYMIGVFRQGERMLFDILKLVLPLIKEPKFFFYFLDSVIKALPQITNRFSAFRLTVTGKLAGGTKRTKTKTVGYGRLSIQTLSVDILNSYVSFTHKAGEFGVKLLMCADSKKLKWF